MKLKTEHFRRSQKSLKRKSTAQSENYHHVQARKIMMQLHPELSKDFWCTHYVHHKDRNPRNNKLDNLEIKDRRLHKFIHSKQRIKLVNLNYMLIVGQ